MKGIRVFLVALFLPTAAEAGSSAITLVQSWSGTLVVPDNNDIGTSTSVEITAPGLTRIEAVTLTMEIEGGWNGDLYCYLVHDGRLAMLLNRPGRTASNPTGFGSSGMNVMFTDLASADVHVAMPDSGVATGMFLPDGRITDPLFVLDTDPRTAVFSSFTDWDPNGTWSLFLADQGAGDTATLKGWTVNVTVVPEVSSTVMLGLAVLTMASLRRRGFR